MMASCHALIHTYLLSVIFDPLKLWATMARGQCFHPSNDPPCLMVQVVVGLEHTGEPLPVVVGLEHTGEPLSVVAALEHTGEPLPVVVGLGHTREPLPVVVALDILENLSQ